MNNFEMLKCALESGKKYKANMMVSFPRLSGTSVEYVTKPARIKSRYGNISLPMPPGSIDLRKERIDALRHGNDAEQIKAYRDQIRSKKHTLSRPAKPMALAVINGNQAVDKIVNSLESVPGKSAPGTAEQILSDARSAKGSTKLNKALTMLGGLGIMGMGAGILVASKRKNENTAQEEDMNKVAMYKEAIYKAAESYNPRFDEIHDKETRTRGKADLAALGAGVGLTGTSIASARSMGKRIINLSDPAKIMEIAHKLKKSVPETRQLLRNSIMRRGKLAIGVGLSSAPAMVLTSGVGKMVANRDINKSLSPEERSAYREYVKNKDL